MYIVCNHFIYNYKQTQRIELRIIFIIHNCSLYDKQDNVHNYIQTRAMFIIVNAQTTAICVYTMYVCEFA